MAITAGSALNSVPAAKPQALSTNYIDFNQDMGWAQQYLPDLMAVSYTHLTLPTKRIV